VDLRVLKKRKKIIYGIEFPIYYLYVGKKLVDKGNDIKVFFKDFSHSLLAVYFKTNVVDVIHPVIWRKVMEEGKLDRLYSWMRDMKKGVGPVKEFSIVLLEKEGETERKRLLFFLSERSASYYPIPGEWELNGFQAKKVGNGKILVSWRLENKLWPDLSYPVEKRVALKKRKN